MGGSMSSVVISGDTSGAITLSAPAVAGTNTATLPAATGTVMVSGAMPAALTYISAAQSLSGSTYTKLQFNTIVFDTASSFNTSTYRFTASVAGYYQINIRIATSTSAASIYPTLYKNGSVYLYGVGSINVAGVDNSSVLSTLVYLGINDYVEVYAFANMALTTYSASTASTSSQFSIAMVRSA